MLDGEGEVTVEEMKARIDELRVELAARSEKEPTEGPKVEEVD